MASVVDSFVVGHAGQQPHHRWRSGTLCGVKSGREGRRAQGVAARVSEVEYSVYAGLLVLLLHIRHADLGATECEVMFCQGRVLILINARRIDAVKIRRRGGLR